MKIQDILFNLFILFVIIPLVSLGASMLGILLVCSFKELLFDILIFGEIYTQWDIHSVDLVTVWRCLTISGMLGFLGILVYEMKKILIYYVTIYYKIRLFS